MKYLFSVGLFLISKTSFSQNFKSIQLTKADRAQNLLYHYLAKGEYAGAELRLYKDGFFKYEDATCLTKSYSKGTWTLKNGTFHFRSSLQKNNLLVEVQYRNRTPSDSLIKTFSIVNNIEGEDVSAMIAVNNDSIRCFYGDIFCTNEFARIDSFQVILENGVSSKWIKPISLDKIIEITVQTNIDLNKYIIYNSRFKIVGNKLNYLDN